MSARDFAEPVESTLGAGNRLFGWSLFLIGILYGMALGLFAFDGPFGAPARFAAYDGVPRRLVRLAHIACMALGIVNVMYGHEIDRVRLAIRWRRLGAFNMMAAGALMPLLLTIAAFQVEWKFGLPIPSVAALVATTVMVAGLVQERRTS